MSTLLQDLRYGLRMLAKNPGVTAVAVLALATGIAVNTAIFSVYNAAMLRPIQATDPHRVVNIYRSTIEDRYGQGFSHPDYIYYRDRNTVLSSLIAESETDLTLSETSGANNPAAMGRAISGIAGIHFFQQMAGSAEFVPAAMVSENYFSTLGISPVMGRTFSTEEARSAYPVVMLSHNFWQRRCNSDPNLLGKILKLNGKPFTVIGITPEDFMGTYPSVPSVWLALSAFPVLEPKRDPLHDRDDDAYRLFGRLKPGVTMGQAQAQMTVLADQLRRTYPPGSSKSKPVSITMTPGSPLHLRPTGDVMTIVALVMGAVGLVLLIACANVAGLQLARAAARQKEIGVRLALGASRGRLIRQLLTEAALLAVLAGGIGLLFAWWAVRLLVTAISDSLPAVWGTLALQVDPDLRVFGYTLIVSLLAGILFGLAPALEASKPNLTAVLKEEGIFGGKLRGSRMRDTLVAAQVGICMVLLVTAGLLARGSARALRLDPGFETKKVLGMGIEIPPGLGYDATKAGAIVAQLVDRLSNVPGVKSVSQGRAPLYGGVRSASVSFNGPTGEPNAQGPTFHYSYVSSSYFETLSIPIVRGRTFTDEEARTGAAVTIISEATARMLWPRQDPIGKRVALDATKQYHDSAEPFPAGQSFQVIGVTKDIRSFSLAELDPAYFYMPMPRNHYYESLLVRTASDPNALMASLGKEVKAVDPNIIVYADTLDGLRTNNFAFVISRIGAVLSSLIGLLGLLLASVGIYGVVSYAVVRRTREIGIRMTLGARAGDVLKQILRQSMRPVILGMVPGIVTSSAASRLLSIRMGQAEGSSLLFGLSSLDPWAFGGVSLFLTAVALLASYIPARRATKVDPTVALRYE